MKSDGHALWTRVRIIKGYEYLAPDWVQFPSWRWIFTPVPEFEVIREWWCSSRTQGCQIRTRVQDEKGRVFDLPSQYFEEVW